MTEDERKEKGLLWCDTGEYFAEQARAKDLAYAFNHLPPSQKAKRDELLHEIFALSLIHISEPTRPQRSSRMPSSA